MRFRKKNISAKGTRGRKFPKFRWLKPCFLTIVVISIGACTTHPSPGRYPVHNPPLSSPHSVEQHLLSTIKQAESLEPGNPLLLSSLFSLATYYQDQKKFEQAAIQYQRILDLKEAQNGPNHPDLANILNRYAKVLHQANRHSEAKSMTARANSILAKSSLKSSAP